MWTRGLIVLQFLVHRWPLLLAHSTWENPEWLHELREGKTFFRQKGASFLQPGDFPSTFKNETQFPKIPLALNFSGTWLLSIYENKTVLFLGFAPDTDMPKRDGVCWGKNLLYKNVLATLLTASFLNTPKKLWKFLHCQGRPAREDCKCRSPLLRSVEDAGSILGSEHPNAFLPLGNFWT